MFFDFRFIRWLSIDVVAGSVILLYFVAGQFSLVVPSSVYLALGISIWLIYTSDHLRDVKITHNPSLDRHKFHKKYFRPLVVCGMLVLIFGIVNLLYLPMEVINIGLLLGVVCLVYLITSQFLGGRGLKEVAISLLFASGIFIWPVISFGGMDLNLMISWVQLVVLAFLNLMVIAFYELEEDRRDRFYSLVMITGKTGAVRMIYLLAAISISISFVLFFINFQPVLQVFFGIATMVLVVIIYNPVYFRPYNIYQPLSDGIFFIPLFLI